MIPKLRGLRKDLPGHHGVRARERTARIQSLIGNHKLIALSEKKSKKTKTQPPLKSPLLRSSRILGKYCVSALRGSSGNPHSFPTLGTCISETAFETDTERTSPPTHKLSLGSVPHKETSSMPEHSLSSPCGSLPGRGPFNTWRRPEALSETCHIQ